MPGQYCVLGMNNAEKPELGSVRRSMSIASAPEDDGPIEFYIRWVAKPESENPLTHLLWKLKTGDRMYMRPVAAGVFTVKDTVGLDDPRLRVMVAAGTGSAPFVSMVRSELRRNPNADLSKWVLLHGASYPADLGYRDELMRMVETQRSSTGARSAARKRRRTGRATPAASRRSSSGARLDDLEKRLGLPPGGFTPKNVVDLHLRSHRHDHRHDHPADRSRLRPRLQAHPRSARRAAPRSRTRVFYEQYDTEPVINIKDPAVVEPLKARMQAALAKLS